jgi:hypothetical protein
MREELVRYYSSLDDRSQREYLARLVLHITVAGRAGYDKPVDELVGRLRSLNEIVHRIAAQLSSLVGGTRDRYPDQVFANVLLDEIESSSEDAHRAFCWAHARAQATLRNSSAIGTEDGNST